MYFIVVLFLNNSKHFFRAEYFLEYLGTFLHKNVGLVIIYEIGKYFKFRYSTYCNIFGDRGI